MSDIGKSRRIIAEHKRILWRQEMMKTPKGLAKLLKMVNARVRERDMGPQ